MLKRNTSDVYSNTYRKTKIDQDDDLPLEKTLNMYSVIILIKSAFTKYQIIIIIKHF